MSYYHKNLASGGWKKLSFIQKMANIGSEVERTIRWKNKNPKYSSQAFERCLELVDLTIACEKDFFRLRELTRVREGLVDYFFGNNQYSSTADLWKKYFFVFNFAAQIKK